jgi:hypothetical protein
VFGWPGYALVSEPDFFGAQVGPSGNDLSGYRVDAIGFRVDTVTIANPSAGETDFDVSGAFVFIGRVADIRACLDGGWGRLVGPDGSFDNQGECVRTAVIPS